MHSLEMEYLQLQRDGEIDEAATAHAIALERGTLFSVATELRLVLYSSVAAIAAGVGLLLKKNLDRIGPLAVTLGLAAIAIPCYIAGAQMRRPSGGASSTGGEYLLLLGALIVSADLGWAESQFHWLGGHAGWELLLLAALHAVSAYAFGSVFLLTLSLTSLAAWFGIGIQTDIWLHGATVSGWRVLACAAVVLGWRELHRRVGGAAKFELVFDNYAANLGFWSAIILSNGNETRIWGAALALVVGAACIAFGLRKSREAFMVYGVIYPAVVICIVAGHAMRAFADGLILTVMLLTVVVAAALLMVLHGRIKERR